MKETSNSFEQGIRDDRFNKVSLFEKEFVLLRLFIILGLFVLFIKNITKRYVLYLIIIFYIRYCLFKHEIEKAIEDSDYIIIVNSISSICLFIFSYLAENLFGILLWYITIELFRICLYRDERLTKKQIAYDVLFSIILISLSKWIGNEYFSWFVLIYSQICLFLLKREKALK